MIQLLTSENSQGTMSYFKFKFLFSLFFISAFSNAQFSTEELAPMPVRVANNAVVSAKNGTKVYSFAGIDSTKLYSGIHLKSFMYDVGLNTWTTLPDLPDTLGKIAAGASEVKDRIYIIGGYHVFANHNEISSNKVHVYNTLTDSYEADAAPIPVPIDDHVQDVWRDSLIFVVTGWSNNGNVADVQIFNPALNTWEAGTSVPNHIDYKVFGATGKIIGDTIYYYGGVNGGFSFNARNYMRKGVINPNNPTEITWTKEEDAPELAGYRCASFAYENSLLVVGGAGVAYNYDGIAYNGSGGVSPLDRILKYDTRLMSYNSYSSLPEVMDFRGEGRLSANSFVTCGGMEAGQEVTNRVVKYTIDEAQFANIEEQELEYEIIAGEILSAPKANNISILSVEGKLLDQVNTNKYSLNKLKRGFYLIQLNGVNSRSIIKLSR